MQVNGMRGSVTGSEPTNHGGFEPSPLTVVGVRHIADGAQFGGNDNMDFVLGNAWFAPPRTMAKLVNGSVRQCSPRAAGPLFPY